MSNNTAKDQSTVNAFLNEVTPAFNAFKAIADKYPNVIELRYERGEGYFMEVNYDLLELALEIQD